jgi:hypothetical protein
MIGHGCLGLRRDGSLFPARRSVKAGSSTPRTVCDTAWRAASVLRAGLLRAARPTSH